MSDNTDARLLVGLYRCTEIPGQFAWEAGLLTRYFALHKLNTLLTLHTLHTALCRAVMSGSWLLIEDADRAPADTLALLEPLARGGSLTVPSLGGQVLY